MTYFCLCIFITKLNKNSIFKHFSLEKYEKYGKKLIHNCLIFTHKH